MDDGNASRSAVSAFSHSYRWSGYTLGFAIGGFFDGILLHQILQWHHLLSALEAEHCGKPRLRGQAGFWDIDERYARLSEAGDSLEKLNVLVPWEVFCKPLV